MIPKTSSFNSGQKRGGICSILLGIGKPSTEMRLFLLINMSYVRFASIQKRNTVQMSIESIFFPAEIRPYSTNLNSYPFSYFKSQKSLIREILKFHQYALFS